MEDIALRASCDDPECSQHQTITRREAQAIDRETKLKSSSCIARYAVLEQKYGWDVTPGHRRCPTHKE
jgi:hypothetical protein